jgi:hypothetical protein
LIKINTNKILYYFNKLKWYFLIVVSLTILISMSLQENEASNVSYLFRYVLEFLKVYWLHTIIVSFVFALILWFLKYLKAISNFSRITREHEDLKERSEVKTLKQSIHRE